MPSSHIVLKEEIRMLGLMYALWMNFSSLGLSVIGLLLTACEITLFLLQDEIIQWPHVPSNRESKTNLILKELQLLVRSAWWFHRETAQRTCLYLA
ncbi:PREDICTED: putative uncharacterized protein encoded by LINC00301 [Mandrillus leucophaeus]|uniref:putative uncharacterized protein encoded by LINC00301 n=1 Tax=Mandrillus leucophaeus TaxID=9568 RepID=UPI0005F472A1|nr:PREDICTED: putative uncharacterized protein encoded by LINC00301 [Mandrillus leucophaeus]